MIASLKSAVSVLFGMVMALSFATSGLAVSKGSYSIVVNGAPVASCPNAQSSNCAPVDATSEGTGYAAEGHNTASAGIVGASARISGTVSGQASISIESGSYTFSVTPPAPRPNLANGRFVLYMQLDGQLLGTATVDASVQVDVVTP